jgi:hypothetical protein
MKKLSKNAFAIMHTIIASTAKSNLQKTLKMLSVLFLATFIFSACSRNSSSGFGCGAFPYKSSSMIIKTDKKEVKSASNFNKCPQTEKFN